MLAVVHALELWHCYLDGQDFKVVTDTVQMYSSQTRTGRNAGMNEYNRTSLNGSTYPVGLMWQIHSVDIHYSLLKSEPVAATLRFSAAALFPSHELHIGSFIGIHHSQNICSLSG